MPLDLVTVIRIDSVQTANPSVRSFCITATTMEERPRLLQFQTIKELQAAACARAKETDRMIWVTWKDARFRSKDIVAVQLDDSSFSPDKTPKERVI